MARTLLNHVRFPVQLTDLINYVTILTDELKKILRALKALIGARELLGAKPALVVVCGTATTIDFLAASGEFEGGVILPGVGLMLRSLHENTAALPDADGEYVDNPTQTVDAITSGCQHAQAGAIERLYYLHASREPKVACVLSGGAARALSPRLNIPFELHENLVLEGLYRISQTIATT